MRQENKYLGGLTEAWQAGFNVQNGMQDYMLYQLLEARGYAWDEEQGVWGLKTAPKPKPPNQIRVTVRGALPTVRAGADDLERSLLVLGYERVRRIDLLPHPERADEGQVSMTFRLPGKEQGDGN